MKFRKLKQVAVPGRSGCFDCKMKCASKISEFLEPIREKRKYYENNLNEVKDILEDGENAEEK